jgi:hypothetical protein
MRLWLLLCISLLSLAAIAADENDDDTKKKDEKESKWDVSFPPGERREIPLDVRSGTWMSVDVSPDGKRLAFDLLGDIYELPIEGGEARSLTSGMAWDMQPRYSPDGAYISFTSDRAGGDNVWIMNADGSAPRGAISPPASTSRHGARSEPARSGSTAPTGARGYSW